MPRVVQFAVYLLFAFEAFGDLPKPVLSMLKERKSEFREVLGVLSKEQHDLLLERFADLLPKSNAFKEPIDREELLKYLMRKFPAQSKRPEAEVAKIQWAKNLKEQLSAHKSGSTVLIDVECADGIYSLPLQIEKKENALRLMMRGIEIPLLDSAQHNPAFCLEIEVSSLRHSLRIENLRTQTVGCSLPKVKAGACLLQSAERIGSALGAKISRVADFTKFRCPKNNAFVDLRRLKIYQEGQGWYEKKGYAPEQYDHALYTRRIDDFRGYTLLALQKDMREKSIELAQAGLVDSNIETYEKLQDKEETFSAFMKWLWEVDCSAYAEIEKFIFLKRNNLQIARIYPEIYDFAKALEGDEAPQ